MNIDNLRDDLAAFADDDNEFAIDRSGSFVLNKGGTELTGRYVEAESGAAAIKIGEELIPYRQFISHHLAKLDVFAQRLLTKRAPIPAFVNGRSRLDELSQSPLELPALEALDKQCRDSPPFSSRVVFITADAGHGKTALLKQYQHLTAQAFLEGKSRSLFWHVDLQGRQLLRLSEALMGDLGELRMYGLWTQSIIRLMYHRLLVLAVDGFDELAAEQGSTDALGALALLVKQIQDKGTIVAASRRTFFSTDDYLKRTRMLDRTISHACEFTQIHLLNWQREQGLAYLNSADVDGKRFSNPEAIYQELVDELHGQADHPILSRPFLLTHAVKALLRYDLTPSTFVRGLKDPMKGVASVVEAFVAREVSDKWKSKDTGEPYLTAQQHMKLLTAVGEEMWLSQRDRLGVDVIETLAVMLLDDWGIDPDRKHQILEMVKMHALLTRPADSLTDSRAFDHPEFRDYFFAQALADRLVSAVASGNGDSLGRFLSIAQLPDTVARYAAAAIKRSENLVRQMLEILSTIAAKEWKPTFIQPNIGTLVPFLLDNIEHTETMLFDAKVIYSSLVFEGTRLNNVSIRNGTFIQTTFVGVEWANITFSGCEFNNVLLDKSATYSNVSLEDCKINGIRTILGEEEGLQEYAPKQITTTLNSLGIKVQIAAESTPTQEPPPETEKRRLVRRFLRAFQRTTTVSEHIVKMRHKHDAHIILEEIIPLMEKHGIVRTQAWRGRGTPQGLWVLSKSLEDVLRSEGGEGDKALVAFWASVNSS